MPERIVESCQVLFLSVLDENGNVDDALMPSLTDDDVKRSYELMVLSRTFDQRALSLQREGRLGTYASILGQEASQIGSALAIRKSDWIFPSFREMAVYITMGYPLHMLFQYWSGDERGIAPPQDLNIFPLCIPVGTQVPHATGAAMAVQYRSEENAVVCYFGDGGTSKGDFHEGFNMAGVYRLPVVYICQNNQWAISVPRERQTASKTLAQKAFAYGFEGVQVDGNDIFAVYLATDRAMKKARSGGGPTFIECFTYRMSDHTTADDASRYRNVDEVEQWKQKDPLARLRLFLEKRGLMTDQFEQETHGAAKETVDEAVRKAEEIQRPEPSDMFTYTYDKLTPRQERQIRDI